MKKRFLVAALLLASSALRAETVNLLQAWQYALANDPTWQVAQADARYERAEEDKALAGLLPSLSFSASRNKNELDRVGASNNTTRYDSSVDALSLRQPLIRFQSIAEYRRTLAHSAAAEFTLSAAAQQLAVRVAQAYFDALLGEDQLRLARFQVASLSAQQDAAGKSFRSGAGTRIEVDEAASRLAIAISEVQASENLLANARQKLAALLGVEVSGLIALDEKKLGALQLAPADLAAWRDLVMQTNPELQAAGKTIDETAWTVNRARAGHLPTVDLVVSKSRSESETVSTVNSRYDLDSAGIQLNLPIFAGGYVNAETTQARARHQRAQATYEGIRRELETRVEKEFNGITQGRARLESLSLALAASETALKSTRRGVEAGTRNNLDVLNAERQVYSMQLELSRSRHDFVMSRLRLKAMANQLDAEEILLISKLLGKTAP